ncbi:MAG: hypothetical protein AAF628_10210 [Planctomycetota bacterium]
MDDRLEADCCTTPTPHLPAFPPVMIGGDYRSHNVRHPLLGCSVLGSTAVTVTLGAPQQVACNRWNISISVSTPLGLVATGVLLGEYSRTFTWNDPSNQVEELSQVWRFMLNGDLTFQPTIAVTPPPCAPLFNNAAHFVGSIDYERHAVFDPDEIRCDWSFRLDLTHHDQGIHHNVCRPLLSPVTGHVDTRYTLTAPASMIAPGPTLTPGNFTYEATREIDVVLGRCYAENDLGPQPTLITRVPDAMCPFETFEVIQGTSECAGVARGFQTVPNNPRIPTGSIAVYLGTHTGTGGAFPGDLRVFTHVAILGVDWHCNTNPSGNGVLCHGVTTDTDPLTTGDIHPFGIFKDGMAENHVFTMMTDLVNHVLLQEPGPVAVANFGCPDFAELLIQLTL